MHTRNPRFVRGVAGPTRGFALVFVVGEMVVRGVVRKLVLFRFTGVLRLQRGDILAILNRPSRYGRLLQLTFMRFPVTVTR